MLRIFGPECADVPVDAGKLSVLPEGAIWIDLFNPTREEEALAEKLLGANIPTREELAEIEPSSRFYQKRGVTFLNMSVLHGVVGGHPSSDPIGFILSDKHLATVRYIDPKPSIDWPMNSKPRARMSRRSRARSSTIAPIADSATPNSASKRC
jgi:magnesium transporter